MVRTQGVPMASLAAAERTLGFHHPHGSCESILELEVDQEFE